MASAPSNGFEAFKGSPSIMKAIREIETLRDTPVLHVMINKLPSNTEVPIHRDWILPTAKLGKNPCVERWHLPIATNHNCFWWDETQTQIHMVEGVWSGPVPYWLNHKVWNFGMTERIHLVVDLDSPIPVGEYKE